MVGRDRPDVGRRIRLAFLAPDIVAATALGTTPMASKWRYEIIIFWSDAAPARRISA
jgi:hypothetical protein